MIEKSAGVLSLIQSNESDQVSPDTHLGNYVRLRLHQAAVFVLCTDVNRIEGHICVFKAVCKEVNFK